MMKIGLLAAGVTPDALQPQYPTYAQMFALQLQAYEASFEFVTYDVRLGEFPASSSDCDAWLITGSKADAYGDDEWILRLCGLIQDIDRNGKVLVGICFGHQIIARALGGRVEKYQGGWGVGVHQYQVQQPIPTLPQTQTLSLCAFHQDQVVEKPAKLTTFLSSSFCQHAGLIYADKILTFQGHPEFSKQYEGDLLQLYAGVTVPDDIAAQAKQSIADRNIDSPHLMAWIAQFLKGAN
jgi:GMP synthase-like glutamine amidotransferase